MTTVRIDALKYDEQTSRFYAALSIWDTRARYDAALPPDEEQELFIDLPPVDATDRTPRKQGQRYVLAAGGTITQAELNTRFAAYKRGERTNPYLDLAYDLIAVDHAKILQDWARAYITQQKANGRAWRGNVRGKGGFTPRLIDADPSNILGKGGFAPRLIDTDPGNILGKVNVTALVGAVFDL